MPWTLAAVSLGVQLWMCRLFFSFTADDAYIVARYAENLARGNGLVFNCGQYINALTCPLLAFVEAAIFRLSGATVVGYKLLAIVLVLAANVLVLLYLRRSEEAVWLYCPFVLASPFVAFWTVGGMETPLLLLLVTVATLLYLRIVEEGISAGRAAAVSVVFGLCFLTRHDSAPFCGSLAFGLCFRHVFVRYSRHAAWLIVPGGLIACGWMFFALSYFHDMYPTSYYVKTPTWQAYEVGRNVLYLLQFTVFSGLAWVVIWTAGRLAANPSRSWRVAKSHVMRFAELYVGILCVGGYALLSATKHMMFSYRMIVPYLPAIAIGLFGLHAALRRPGAPRSAVNPILLITVLVMLPLQVLLAWHIDRVSINPGWVGEYRQCSRRSYVDGFAKALHDSADAIRRDWSSRPGHISRQPAILTFAAGITPYYLPEGRFLETIVSYRHWHGFDRNEVLDRVDYLMVLVPEHGPMESQVGRELLADLETVARYEFQFNGQPSELYVLFNSHPGPYRSTPYVDGLEIRR